jgi:hypothetical protein
MSDLYTFKEFGVDFDFGTAVKDYKGHHINTMHCMICTLLLGANIRIAPR